MIFRSHVRRENCDAQHYTSSLIQVQSATRHVCSEVDTGPLTRCSTAHPSGKTTLAQIMSRGWGCFRKTRPVLGQGRRSAAILDQIRGPRCLFALSSIEFTAYEPLRGRSAFSCYSELVGVLKAGLLHRTKGLPRCQRSRLVGAIAFASPSFTLSWRDNAHGPAEPRTSFADYYSMIIYENIPTAFAVHIPEERVCFRSS